MINVGNLKARLVILNLLTFIIPPVGWLLLSLFTSLWNFNEFFSVAIGPQIWIYVIPFLVFVIFYTIKNVSNLEVYYQNQSEDNLLKVQKSVASMPKVMIITLIIYCIFGPAASMISKGFSTTQWWLAEVLGIPFILLFSVPFILKAIYLYEEKLKNIPLSKKVKSLSVSQRVSIAALFTVVGVIFTISIAALAVTSKMQGDAFNVLLMKILVISVIGVAIGVFNLSLVTDSIVSHLERLGGLANKIAGGDLNPENKLDIVSRDEFGFLTDTLNNMKVSLHEIIKKINS